MADQEPNLGRKILSFFVKENPNEPPLAVIPPAGPARGVPGATAMPPPPVASSGSVSPGTVDTKFVDHFAQVLEKANQPGPDYFEFRETLRNLAGLGLDETKQYQAAWASFRALAGGTDASVLTNTANQYLTLLNADHEAFQKSVTDALAERVGGLQSEQKQLTTENESLTKQIAELQQRIQTNSDRLAKIGGEIDEQSQKITQNRNNFETTYTHFTEQIKADISKIQTYLLLKR